MQFVLAIVNFLGNACIVKLELLQYSKNDKNNVFCYIYYIVSSLTFVFDKYMKSINFCYSGYHIDAFGKKSRIVKLFLSSQQCIILQQYRIYRQVFIGKYLQASIYRQVFGCQCVYCVHVFLCMSRIFVKTFQTVKFEF